MCERIICISALPCRLLSLLVILFFSNAATPEIYTLSLHDALPIWSHTGQSIGWLMSRNSRTAFCAVFVFSLVVCRSEEHTSELQSHSDLVCRLLLEKKK